MALFLVVEAARKPKGWGGEARGNEGKEKEERKSQGAWLVKSQCIKEAHGAGKPATAEGKGNGGAAQSARFKPSFVHLFIHSSNKMKDAHAVIIAIQDTSVGKMLRKCKKKGANYCWVGGRSGEVRKQPHFTEDI